MALLVPLPLRSHYHLEESAMVLGGASQFQMLSQLDSVPVSPPTLWDFLFNPEMKTPLEQGTLGPISL